MLAIRALVLGLAAACGDPAAPLPGLVVPVQIVAEPDVDTVPQGDSVRLTLHALGEIPTEVQWVLGPAHGDSDTLLGDTIVLSPRVVGEWIVRAVATFPGERVGSATRVLTISGAALSTLVIVTPEGQFGAVAPLGDTVTLRARYDSAVAAGAVVQWFEESTVFAAGTALGSGDALRLPLPSVGERWIRAELTAPDARRVIRRTRVTTYDPITPAAWRRVVVGGYGGGQLTRHPSGFLLTHANPSTIDTGYVVAFAPDTDLWQVRADLEGSPLTGAADGGVYFVRGGTLVKLDATGATSWTAAGADPGVAELQDGRVAVGSAATVRVLHPDGMEDWRVAVDSTAFQQVQGIAVGADTSLYVLGFQEVFGPIPRVGRLAAFDAQGNLRWDLSTGRALPRGGVLVADDSTIVVHADSLYAVRPDGSVRWTAPYAPGTHPVVRAGVLFVPVGSGVRALALADGALLWTAATGAAAVLVTADGQVVTRGTFEIVTLDAGTGAERWRHVTAGGIRDMLLTPDGTLVVSDWRGFVEGVDVGSGPAPSAWPMAWGGPERSGRSQ